MRKFLLYSSALVAFTMSGMAEAACIQTPTCSSLGYDSSKACEGGLKCPFGNAWNCTLINKITEVTNKITTLEEKIVTIENSTSSSNCQIGDILYSDKTIYADNLRNKTPIGVVFDCDRKLAVGLTFDKYLWTDTYFDVPGIFNITSKADAMNDLEGKKNTSAAIAYCKSNGLGCGGFEYVYNYKTEGTNAGDWYVPALGELYSIYINQDAINNGLNKAGADRLSTISNYWSSTEANNTTAWELSLSSGYYNNAIKSTNYVIPVIAF